jgi:hypothetical protein
MSGDKFSQSKRRIVPGTGADPVPNHFRVARPGRRLLARTRKPLLSQAKREVEVQESELPPAAAGRRWQVHLIPAAIEAGLLHLSILP